MVENAAVCQRQGGANMLGALAISVPAIYRSNGYARMMIKALLDLAQREGLGGLIAPVRPSLKSRHPDISIYDYITWTDATAARMIPGSAAILPGGRLVRPCERSMVVHEHVGFWESWSRQKFETSGQYLLEGALVPIEIDLDRNFGRYKSPTSGSHTRTLDRVELRIA